MHCNDFLDLFSFVGVYKSMPLEFRDTGFPRGGGKVNCYQGSADSFAAGADEKYLIISVTNANNSAQYVSFTQAGAANLHVPANGVINFSIPFEVSDFEMSTASNMSVVFAVVPKH